MYELTTTQYQIFSRIWKEWYSPFSRYQNILKKWKICYSVRLKKVSVKCTRILALLFRLKTSLVYHTLFFIDVFALFLIFQSFVCNFVCIEKRLPKIIIDNWIFQSLNRIFEAKSYNRSKQGPQNFFFFHLGNI